MRGIWTIGAAVLFAIVATATPALAANCVITDTVVTPNGVPAKGVRVEFRAVVAQTVNNQLLLSNPVVAITDATGQLRVNGVLGVTMLQGATVKVTSVGLGLSSATILVPSTGSAVLRTLVASYMAPATGPAVDDATDLVMGDSDVGLISYASGDTIAAVIKLINQAAGAGGGGGGPANGTFLLMGTPAGGFGTGVATLSAAHNVTQDINGVNVATKTAVDGKANTSHTHVESDVTNLVSDLAGKAAALHAAAHSAGGGDPITHNNLAGLTTGDPHTQYLLDTDRGAISGVCPLDAGQLVPIANLPTATTSAIGAVRLATTSSDTTAGRAVQASDARLSDARTPSSTLAHQSSHQSGGGDALTGNLDAVARTDVRKNSTGSVFSRRRINLIEGSNVTITAADDSGSEEVDVTIAAAGSGGVADGDKTDITVSGSGATWTVDNDVVTYAKMQNVSATDKCLGRVSASAGDVEEFTCTAAGRALIDDVDAAAQRTTLGLGTLATQSGTFSGTSSGTNTGDQTITLNTDVTGSGTGTIATTIAANAVTNTKAADMAANSIKGNNTGSTADPADLTATQATAMLDTVTSSVKGLAVPPVRLATTTNDTLSGLAARDGVTPVGGDLVLAKNQTTASANGPYVAASGSWTRATWFDVSAEAVPGMVITVAEGTANGDTEWMLTTDAAITLGSTSLTFAESDQKAVLAGTGLTRTTNTLAISSGGVGSTEIADGAVALADMANLAQDQFIGRTTASTGVPQTATITAAARTVLDDTTTGAMKTTLGAENALTFSTGLTRSTDTVTVNTSQNIAKLSNLTSNGCVQTSGSDGTLSITTCGSGGSGYLGVWHYQAESLNDADPNTATTANAIMVDAVSDPAVQTRKYLGASLTGSGGKLMFPHGSTSCLFEWVYQASAAPGTTNNKVQWELGTRALGTTGSNTVYDYTVQTNANNTTMAYFSQTVSLATMSLSADTPYEFQLLRKTASVTNNMTQDAYLSEWIVSCN